MTRVLTQILAAVVILATPAVAQPDTQQANTATIQLAQSTSDGRVQGVQPVSPPAPNTRPLGAVSPYGWTGDDSWRRGPVGPPLPPPAERPPVGYPSMSPSQGLILIPGGG